MQKSVFSSRGYVFSRFEESETRNDSRLKDRTEGVSEEDENDPLFSVEKQPSFSNIFRSRTKMLSFYLSMIRCINIRIPRKRFLIFPSIVGDIDSIRERDSKYIDRLSTSTSDGG